MTAAAAEQLRSRVGSVANWRGGLRAHGIRRCARRMFCLFTAQAAMLLTCFWRLMRTASTCSCSVVQSTQLIMRSMRRSCYKIASTSHHLSDSLAYAAFACACVVAVTTPTGFALH